MRFMSVLAGSVVLSSFFVVSSAYGMDRVDFEHSVVGEDKTWELKFDDDMGIEDVERVVKVIDSGTGIDVEVEVYMENDNTYLISSNGYEIGHRYEIVVSGDMLKSEYRKTFDVSGSLSSVEGYSVGNERGMEIKKYGRGNGIVYDGLLDSGRVGSRYVTGVDEVVEGVRIGSDSRDNVRRILPNKIDHVLVEGTRFMFDDSGEYDVFDVDNRYVFSFYDRHKGDVVRSVYWIEKDKFNENPSYLLGDASLRSYFEDSMVDFINASRVEEGLTELRYDVMMNRVARKHSENMVRQGFFDHTDTMGKTVADRVSVGGYRVSVVGENLAYGQLTAMFAHENLMNSLGHRANILNGDYRYVGVGVDFDEENAPYFTIVFYR